MRRKQKTTEILVDFLVSSFTSDFLSRHLIPDTLRDLQLDTPLTKMLGGEKTASHAAMAHLKRPRIVPRSATILHQAQIEDARRPCHLRHASISGTRPSPAAATLSTSTTRKSRTVLRHAIPDTSSTCFRHQTPRHHRTSSATSPCLLNSRRWYWWSCCVCF